MSKLLTKLLIALHLKHRGTAKIDSALSGLDSLVDKLNSAVDEINDEQQHHADSTAELQRKNQEEIARLQAESATAQKAFSNKMNELDLAKSRALRAATRIAQLTA